MVVDVIRKVHDGWAIHIFYTEESYQRAKRLHQIPDTCEEYVTRRSKTWSSQDRDVPTSSRG